MKKAFKLIISTFTIISLISCNKPKTYTVTWQNYDNSVLETDDKVKKGEMPQYDGATPTKDEDETYYYVFAGWTPELTEVSEDTTYTATFTAKLIVYYHVTFVNYDDSVLYETTVREGREAVYDGEAPTRPEDDEFKYEFEKWDKDLTSITSELTVKAVYKYIPQENWGEIIFP